MYKSRTTGVSLEKNQIIEDNFNHNTSLCTASKNNIKYIGVVLFVFKISTRFLKVFIS